MTSSSSAARTAPAVDEAVAVPVGAPLNDLNPLVATSHGGPWPADEKARLRAFHACRVMQNFPTAAVQQLTEVTACLAGTPIAFVAFVDHDETHVMTGVNCGPRSDPRFETLCGHVIAQPDQTLVVHDISTDPRFVHLRHIGVARNFRFYAGVSVLSPDGYPIGTLCVLDAEPRELSERQLEAIRHLARAVTPRIELAMQVEKMQAEREKFRAFMDNGPTLAFIKDAEGRYEYVNQRLLDRFKFGQEDIIGKTDADLWPSYVADRLRANDVAVMASGRPVEITEPGPSDENGEPTWWQSSKFVVPGEQPMLGGVAMDVSALKVMQARLEQLVRTDPLTQLPNRVALHEFLPVAISNSLRTTEPMAVLFADIDRFKEVNDTFGHEIGDLLLIEFSRRVRTCVRKSDVVARLAGDEFVIVLERLTGLAQARQIAQKLVRVMEAPVVINGTTHALSTSVGVAVMPPGGVDAQTLLERADQAMYRAKAAGRNQIATAT